MIRQMTGEWPVKPSSSNVWKRHTGVDWLIRQINDWEKTSPPSLAGPLAPVCGMHVGGDLGVGVGGWVGANWLMWQMTRKQKLICLIGSSMYVRFTHRRRTDWLGICWEIFTTGWAIFATGQALYVRYLLGLGHKVIYIYDWCEVHVGEDWLKWKVTYLSDKANNWETKTDLSVWLVP